jgi:polysaccharide export outer membrane protein
LTHFIGACVASVLLLSACAGPKKPASDAAPELDPLVLNAGDVLKIAFPGTPNLDTSQQIRRDGKINLEIAGEVKAAGKTPAELEKELIQAFAPHLVTKDVKVTVVSSTFTVFVIGAVVNPGKLQLERAVTAFEAIMEAGGFDMEKANLRAVVVIRNEGGANKNYKLNLKALLDGKPTEPFRLKPFDTVYVPEKFNWF